MTTKQLNLTQQEIQTLQKFGLNLESPNLKQEIGNILNNKEQRINNNPPLSRVQSEGLGVSQEGILGFQVLRIKDGTEFVNQAFKNPSIADRLLSKNIIGLVKNPDLSDFWIGSISENGLVVPVYFPKMKESFAKILTVSFVRILADEITSIDNLKKAVVYFVDRLDEVDDYLKSKDGVILNNNGEKVEIEFRHVSEVVDDSWIPDDFKFEIDEAQKLVRITKFRSQYLFQKITGENIFMFENGQGIVDFEANPTNGGKISISDNSLELIESVSLDCTNASGDIWQSDFEIKIDPKKSTLIINGVKTKDFWDSTISFDKKPLRIKVRSIAGDEVVKIVQV
jgi:adenine-specific DNA-methyltransferase